MSKSDQIKMTQTSNNYKIILVSLIGFLTIYSSKSIAQQLPLFSQLEIAQNINNPAYVDSSFSTLQLNTTYREQWSKFELPNRSFVLTGTKLFNQQNLKLSLSLLSDQIGLTKRQGILNSVGYRLNLTQEAYLALGIGFALEQFTFDKSEVRGESGDLLFQNIIDNELYLSLNTGISLRIHGFSLGFSLFNIDNTSIENQFYRTVLHYNTFASYSIRIKNDLELTPLFWYKNIVNNSGQLSMLLKTKYKQKYTLNIGFHGSSAYIFGLGFQLRKQIGFNLFYDYQRNPQRSTTGEVFEFAINYRFK